jgi:hypothetical protein
VIEAALCWSNCCCCVKIIPAPTPPTKRKSPSIVAIILPPANFFFGFGITEEISGGAAEPLPKGGVLFSAGAGFSSVLRFWKAGGSGGKSDWGEITGGKVVPVG